MSGHPRVRLSNWHMEDLYSEHPATKAAYRAQPIVMSCSRLDVERRSSTKLIDGAPSMLMLVMRVGIRQGSQGVLERPISLARSIKKLL
jgi:hypothetical protein